MPEEGFLFYFNLFGLVELFHGSENPRTAAFMRTFKKKLAG